ncbi:Sialate O-acetylesterase [Hypsibius exemplaris]|uniref:Sialate O-acetylesterase n=1 Tax=Hypsibius exemplaris TaxID=2072580 RepID=A0A1W0WXC9_HYPEX|nr:Sialate O-acetylesterase [Hypsibius exemplaris]
MFPKYDPVGGEEICKGKKKTFSHEEKYRFWIRAAAVVFSIQAFIFLVMVTGAFIIFYPKEEAVRKTDFSLVLLRLGFPHSDSGTQNEGGFASGVRPRRKWHWHWMDRVRRDPLAERQRATGVEFRFANYFQDNMVLQRGEPGPEIWGFGEAKQNVSLTFKGQQLDTSVDGNGIWRIRLPITEAGGPYVIHASSVVAKSPVDIKIRSVLFGDVWLCSGQSNMEFFVERMFNASQELEAASTYRMIRFTEILQSESPQPVLEPLIRQVWSSPDAVTLKEFSAVCWAFGRRLQEKLHIPIGLIGSYYGGTPIRAWSDPGVISHCNKSTKPFKSRSNTADSGLWNAMIAPLLLLEINGAIWYQGEADASGDYNGYLCMFPTMIESWRRQFRRPTMPFGFVQLADKDGEDVGTPVVRWHQTADVGVVPNAVLQNVFMAVAMDLSDPESPYNAIHPRYKEEVAERLFLGALTVAYNLSTPFQGPSPVALSYSKSSVLITFKDGPISLRTNLSSAFEVCCGDSDEMSNWTDCKAWEAVTALGNTETSLTLDVASCGQKVVQFVRHAWKTTPCAYLQCAVYGADTALPAGPFVLPVQGAH